MVMETGSPSSSGMKIYWLLFSGRGRRRRRKRRLSVVRVNMVSGEGLGGGEN
jgi:hypothetical protein